MNKSARITFLYVLTCLMLPAGCSRAPPPSPDSTVLPGASRFVAIARGKVDVEGGLVHLSAPREGTVSRVFGEVGDELKEGDPVFSLDTTQAEIARDAAKADLAAATAQVQLLRSRVDALKVHASRAEQAAQAGAASDQAAEDSRQGVKELVAEIAVAEAGVEGAKQKLKQAEYEIRVRGVRSPVSAKIVSRTLRVGDQVSPATPSLVELLPQEPLIVRAEINESFVSKVAVGMSAEVRSEADQEHMYTAKILRIGAVFGPSKLVENTEQATDARDVECILALKDTPLRVGERVQVRILGASR